MNIYRNRITINITEPEDIKLSVIAYSLDQDPDWIINVTNQVSRFFNLDLILQTFFEYWENQVNDLGKKAVC